MKFKLSFRTLLLLSLTLTSCEKETKELPASTKEWIKDVKSTSIHFLSNTGEHETLTVNLKEDKLVKVHGNYQWVKATFTGQQENLGIAIQAEGNFVDFINRAADDFERDYVTVVTGNKPDEEYLTPFGVEAAELLDDHIINGKKYNRVLHVTFLPSAANYKVRELYFARTEGIISFTTTDNKVWLKQ